MARGPRPGTSVTVRVPASSANLGPGFDSLGCALGVWDTCHATVTAEPGLVIEVRGEGEGEVPLDEHHLVHRSMRTAWAELGGSPPSGLRLECDNAVPHGRGLGSSATAIVTGVVLAQALVAVAENPVDAGLPVAVDLDWAGALAVRLEGHPDNASASVYGGVTLSWSDDLEAGASTVRLPVHPDLEPVVLVPDAQLSTARARSVLPPQVRLADAAANSARAALLPHALALAPERLYAATRDWLHQEARRLSYPRSMDLVDALRAVGYAAVVSGAGPSVLVLVTRDVVADVVARAPAGWRVLTPGIPAAGAEALAGSG
ncbi:MAG: homoserine kinase [Dermatophilaceae bacterium]